MNTSTEHILQCNQSEPLADASGKIVDLMNENDASNATRNMKKVNSIGLLRRNLKTASQTLNMLKTKPY